MSNENSNISATTSCSSAPATNTTTDVPEQAVDNTTLSPLHDRLFKLLILTFFREFIQLFLPKVAAYTDFSTLTPVDKEIFTDITAGEKHESDIVMQAQFTPAVREQREAARVGKKYQRRAKPSKAAHSRGASFLIHVENQASSQSEFSRRMFIYFSRLIEKFDLDVYPVAVFSFDEPYRAEPDQFSINFPDITVVDFKFRSVQLNRLDWHDYVNRPNPVASALMAKMAIQPEDRPIVKAQCMAMLLGLELDEARTEMVREFVDSYLALNAAEEQRFQRKLDELIPPPQKERAMQVLDSWTKKGIEQGLVQGKQEGLVQGLELGKQEGRREGELSLLKRQLTRKLGQSVPVEVEGRLQTLGEAELTDLGEALFDFGTLADLMNWLDQYQSQEAIQLKA